VLRQAFRTKAVSSGGRIWERVLAPGPFPSPLTNSSGQKFEAIEKRGVVSVGNSLTEAPSPNRLAWPTNAWGDSMMALLPPRRTASYSF
jgi:hypothetical protein